jgi:photosystem II stability/assembly factor-like uncharacterized protein
MKLHLIIYTISVFILASSCANKKENDENQPVVFEWKQSYLGGGGYITGMVQHPANPDILFARCDVAGLFKSDNAGKSWRLINKGLQQGYNHNTESVCISQHNPDVMFRASGEARNHKLIGELHKSNDGGENWHLVSQDVDFFGNGPNRMYDERIAVDPFKSENVVAAGFSKGIWISNDTGETWQYADLENEPIVSLSFHPQKPGIVYAATLHDMRMKDYLFSDIPWTRPNNGRLFKSTDSGKTWNLLFEKANLDFTQLAFCPENEDKIIASTQTHGIIISYDGGVSFTESNRGLPWELGFNTVSIDPGNPEVVYTAADRRGEDIHVPHIPLYKSTDGGISWNVLHNYTKANFKKYPTYVRSLEHIGWAISKLMVDKNNPNRMFMSNWYGVSVSNDGGINWSGNNFQGTETVCIENLVVDNATEGRSGFVMPDHRPFIGNDFGYNYQQVNAVTEYKNSTAIVFSQFNSDLIIFAGKRDWLGEQGSAILLSRDNGKTFGVVKEFDEWLTVQAIKEDPHNAGIFYAYIDRFIDKGAGLYKSTDWGESWEQINLELPEYIKSLPHQMHFIENEVLSVTYGQQKNVCGTNQLLCLDQSKEGTIYFGEWTEGLFRSMDNGETWQNISEGLPFKKDTTSILIDIKTDKSRPGVVYAGFIKEGLWKSIDYGDTWKKAFPTDSSNFNASSIAIGGKNNREMVIASEPLYWSPSPSAVFYSADAGETWQNIYDNSFGALRWKSIGIEEVNGTIYGVTSGNGAFFTKRL